MHFAVATPAVFAARIELVGGAPAHRESPLVALFDFLGDDVDADAADARGRPREVAIDERLLEADSLENLRSAVALERRDAHLGHHLEDALVERLDVVQRRLLARDALDHALADHVVERFERQIRIDRASAVADEKRDVMDLARVARLEEQRAARARALTDEMMVDTRRCEQARDRRALLGHAAIREDDDRVAGTHGVARLCLKALHRALQRRAAFPRVVNHRQRHGPETLEVRVILDVAQLCQLIVVDDRIANIDLPARFGLWQQQVPLRPDRRLHRRHELFADRVERRIGDLREELLEIVVEQPRALGQRRQRRVGAHRTQGLLGRARHVRQQDRDVFLGVAERLLPAQHSPMIRRRQVGRLGNVFDRDQVFGEPVGVGILRARAAP